MNIARIKNIFKKPSEEQSLFFYIDQPQISELVSCRKTDNLNICGWLIDLKRKGDFSIIIEYDGRKYKAKTGIKRVDVAKHFKSNTQIDKKTALESGFGARIAHFHGGLIKLFYEHEGALTLFKELNIDFKYVERGSFDYFYNKNLATNYAMHQIVLAKNQKRFYKPMAEANFVRGADDPRVIAIYLPQFHTFDLNNQAWGVGFTEWTNVTMGQPRFVGHRQPLLPSDLGFYDLERPEKIKEQIDLAKKYGIYGFQFYYYWFSGEKIMDKPLNTILEHPEWDFNFSICWANENWSKRWDGSDDKIIIAQKYREEDPIAFIKDVAHILNDKRYITQDGKPILSVYRITHLDNPKRYAEIWRKYFREKFGKELYLMAVNGFNDDDPRKYGFDVAMDFMPMSVGLKSQKTKKTIPTIDVSGKLIDAHFQGTVYDFQKIAMNEALDSANFYTFPTIPCVSPSWDNDARRKGKGSMVFYGNSPDIYEKWLSRIIKKELVSGKKSPIIYINAWNEWGEGAMLEPTVHYGHAVLRKTAEALSKYSNNDINKANFAPNTTTKEEKS
jgi:hypothetical protein